MPESLQTHWSTHPVYTPLRQHSTHTHAVYTAHKPAIANKQNYGTGFSLNERKFTQADPAAHQSCSFAVYERRQRWKGEGGKNFIHSSFFNFFFIPDKLVKVLYLFRRAWGTVLEVIWGVNLKGVGRLWGDVNRTMQIYVSDLGLIFRIRGVNWQRIHKLLRALPINYWGCLNIEVTSL